MTWLKLKFVQEYGGRFYFRRKGQAKIRLPGVRGSREFMAAYHAALDAKPAPASRQAPGSLAQLVIDYRRSAEFQNLKPSSQRTYGYVLDALAAKHGRHMVADMRPKDARFIVEEIGATRPAMANLTRKVLGVVMQFAVYTELRETNPAIGIKSYKIGTRHTWTDVELKTFEDRWPIGTRERLVYAVFLYTGQRGIEVVGMARPQSSADSFHVEQSKTGAKLRIPIHPNLWAAIKAVPAKGTSLIGDRNGRPITRAEATRFLKRAIRDAGLPAHCLPHGLRKAMSRRLADRGSSTKQIQAVTGHRSLREIERYTDAADQRRLSIDAIAKLEADGTESE